MDYRCRFGTKTGPWTRQAPAAGLRVNGFATSVPAKRRVRILSRRGKVARPRGFEPPTPSSGGWCSIQLSYRRASSITGGKDNQDWSGREDLNLRPPAPKAGALPDCATPREITLAPRARNYVAGAPRSQRRRPPESPGRGPVQATGPSSLPGTHEGRASGSAPTERTAAAQTSSGSGEKTRSRSTEAVSQSLRRILPEELARTPSGVSQEKPEGGRRVPGEFLQVVHVSRNTSHRTGPRSRLPPGRPASPAPRCRRKGPYPGADGPARRSRPPGPSPLPTRFPCPGAAPPRGCPSGG